MDITRPRMTADTCSVTMVRFIDMFTALMKPTAPTVAIAQKAVSGGAARTATVPPQRKQVRKSQIALVTQRAELREEQRPDDRSEAHGRHQEARGRPDRPATRRC